MISTATFNGKMDQDTSPMYLKKGDVISRRNCRVSVGDGGDSYVNKPFKGTLPINVSFPLGLNKAVGAVEYLEKGGFIYANYNGLSNHGIYWYDGTENKVLLISSVLNFQLDNVVDMRILGDMLVFTDDYNEPRVLSISRALTYSNSGTVSGFISEGGEDSVGIIRGTVKAFSEDAVVGSITGTVNAYYENAVGNGNIKGTVSGYYTLGTVAGTINEQT